MTMELIVKPIQNIKAIEFNFEELKKELEIALKKYQNLVYTENIKEAKEDRAKLNKLLTAIENKRKEIKKEWNEPYLKFEEQIKKLTGLIGSPLLEIDTQIKAAEEKRKEERKEHIIHYWDNLIDEGLKDCINFELIFCEKWLNATEKIEKVYAEMQIKVESIQKDLEVLENFEDKSKIVSLKQKYFRNLNLSEVLKIQKIEDDEKKRILEAEERRQEEAKRQEELKKEAVKTEEEPEPEIVKNKEENIIEIKYKKVLKRTFEVEATVDQLKILGDFMFSQNIKFNLIKRG